MDDPRPDPWIDVDWTTFDPWRICAVQHRLMAHPLLRPARLVELGQRLETRGQVRTHSSSAAAGTPFNDAPSLHPNVRSAASTLSEIASASAWMSLLNIQTDDVYRGLVDEILSALVPMIEQRDPGMCYRGGWIFVTSPNTVTPFHMDREHNFIMQVAGHKRLYVWDYHDVVAVSEHARDQFHDTHSRDLVAWREDLRSRARVFELKPGMGAYMPSTSPHLVENGDNPSITISFTYYTDATRKDSLLHKAHNRLRGVGITPPPVGARRLQDSMLHWLFKHGASRESRRDAVPYARHLFS